MSIDLSRPLVNSMGHHDPLDGLITCLELRILLGSNANNTGLDAAIADFTQMCRQGQWATDDPLGIGGLLDDAARLAPMVLLGGMDRRDLLVQLLRETRSSLEAFARPPLFAQSPERRLAFRELGLSIGLHGLPQIAELATQDAELAELTRELLPYKSLAKQIETTWSSPEHQETQMWREHRDINMAMLATSLAPIGYFGT